MKTFLLLAALCIAAFTSHAGGLKNKSNCALRITPVCYSASTCTGSICGTSVIVPANGSLGSLPTCNPICPDFNYMGYIVSYNVPGCTPMSVTVGDPFNPCSPTYPSSGLLSPCPGCGGLPLNIYYVGSDLVVEP